MVKAQLAGRDAVNGLEASDVQSAPIGSGQAALAGPDVPGLPCLQLRILWVTQAIAPAAGRRRVPQFHSATASPDGYGPSGLARTASRT